MIKKYLGNPFSLTKKKFENNSLLNNHLALKNAHFYYDNDTDFKIYEYNNNSLIMIGYILDIRNGNRSESEILNELLNFYISDSEEFYKNYEYMNGRFILIFDTEDDTTVYTDATSMRPLFY